MKGVNFDKIIKYFKFLTKIKKRRFSIVRDWKVILVIAVVVLGVVCVIDGYVYWGYKEGLIADVGMKNGVMISVDTVALNQILDEIDNRRQEFERQIANPEEVENPFIEMEESDK